LSGFVLAATRSSVETPASVPECVATAVPQLSQNLAAGEIAVPHSAQAVAGRTVPQPAQNLAPFRFSIPHEEHRMLPDLISVLSRCLKRTGHPRLSQRQIPARLFCRL
jgi:hypothetical protein